jgi:hypothetical protein
MKNLMTRKLNSIVLVMAFSGILASCKKDAPMGAEQQQAMAAASTTSSNTEAPSATETPTNSGPSYSTMYTKSVNFNNRANGWYYLSQAAQDMGTVSYWNAYASSTYNTQLKVVLQAGVVGPTGGAMSKIDVPDATAYQLNYDLMFDNNFDFSYGGKVGFGLFIGNGYTGGVPGWDGNGGSARLMWYKSNGRVYLKPYVYYRDQPGNYGNDFGKTYPATGNIAKGVWHHVQMFVKSNTGSNTDGRLQILINGTTVIDQAIRWTTNDLKRLINNVCFENFRGGSESYWQSATNGNIYFDNISWTALQ